MPKGAGGVGGEGGVGRGGWGGGVGWGDGEGGWGGCGIYVRHSSNEPDAQLSLLLFVGCILIF